MTDTDELSGEADRWMVIKEFVRLAVPPLLRPVGQTIVILVIMSPAFAIGIGVQYVLVNYTSTTGGGVVVFSSLIGIVGYAVLGMVVIKAYDLWQDAKANVREEDHNVTD